MSRLCTFACSSNSTTSSSTVDNSTASILPICSNEIPLWDGIRKAWDSVNLESGTSEKSTFPSEKSMRTELNRRSMSPMNLQRRGIDDIGRGPQGEASRCCKDGAASSSTSICKNGSSPRKMKCVSSESETTVPAPAGCDEELGMAKSQ